MISTYQILSSRKVSSFGKINSKLQIIQLEYDVSKIYILVYTN